MYSLGCQHTAPLNPLGVCAVALNYEGWLTTYFLSFPFLFIRSPSRHPTRHPDIFQLAEEPLCLYQIDILSTASTPLLLLNGRSYSVTSITCPLCSPWDYSWGCEEIRISSSWTNSYPFFVSLLYFYALKNEVGCSAKQTNFVSNPVAERPLSAAGLAERRFFGTDRLDHKKEEFSEF